MELLKISLGSHNSIFYGGSTYISVWPQRNWKKRLRNVILMVLPLCRNIFLEIFKHLFSKTIQSFPPSVGYLDFVQFGFSGWRETIPTIYRPTLFRRPGPMGRESSRNLLQTVINLTTLPFYTGPTIVDPLKGRWPFSNLSGSFYWTIFCVKSLYRWSRPTLLTYLVDTKFLYHSLSWRPVLTYPPARVTEWGY